MEKRNLVAEIMMTKLLQVRGGHGVAASRASYGQVLELTRDFLNNPNQLNEGLVYECMRKLFVSKPPAKTIKQCLRLRLFLFRYKQQYLARNNFKHFVGREKALFVNNDCRLANP